MNRNISDKDKKDWENFLSEDESLPNKDLETLKNNKITSRLCDLHGYSLDEANKKINDLICNSYEAGISKLRYLVTKKGVGIVFGSHYIAKDILRCSEISFIR